MARFTGIVFNDQTLIWRQSESMWPSAMNLSCELNNGQHHFEKLNDCMTKFQVKIEGEWRSVYAFTENDLDERIKHLTGFDVEAVREYQASEPETLETTHKAHVPSGWENNDMRHARMKKEYEDRIRAEAQADQERLAENQRRAAMAIRRQG